MANAKELKTCAVCGKSLAPHELIPGIAVRDVIADEILREHPGWSQENSICRTDLNRYRAQYVHRLLQSEKGELSSLEQEVVHSLRDHDTLSKDVDTEFEDERTLGERLADRIAAFGGSWTFLICFGGFLVLWIGSNSFVLYARPPDPDPYILLNLVLSCIAAIQAPVIMMSGSQGPAAIAA